MKYFTISSLPMLTAAIMLATCSIGSAQSLNSLRQEGDSACSDRTLVGDYGVKIEGTRLTNGDTVRTLALFRFDGHRGLTALAYAVVNGAPPPNNDWGETTGTYSMNPNCTGTMALVFPPIHFHFVVTDAGRQLYLVTDGEALAGEARKVHPKSGEDDYDSNGSR